MTDNRFALTDNPFALTGKRILITGASSGIGRACAEVCARLGAALLLVGRNEQRLGETLAALTGNGHETAAADLADPAEIAGLFARHVGPDAPLAGMIHAAGIAPIAQLNMTTPETVNEVMSVNYYSFLELTKELSKKRHRAPTVSLVAVSSVSACAGWRGGVLYAGSKGALEAAVRSMAVELAEKKIRVNTVVPSNIQTPLYDEMIRLDPVGMNAALEKKQPLGIGRPEDVACACAYLLSDAARFVTGSALVVDGGYLAQ